jgi:hypothetical protein
MWNCRMHKLFYFFTAFDSFHFIEIPLFFVRLFEKRGEIL